MRQITLNDKIQLKNTIVTIGKFDGVHKGHEKLFEVVKDAANGRQKVVLTFEASPKSFLEKKANKTIVTEIEKQMLCKQHGMDIYIKMPMTEEFLSLSADAFLNRILKEKLGMTTLVCGPDFRFGSKASGDVDFLKQNQKKYGYNLIVVEKEQYHNTDISSTQIREKILQGKMSEVNEMLDHPYRIIGKVSEGKKLGRKMDIPTANIIPEETKLLPPNGVYRSVVVVDGKRYNAISNIGVNPTVETGNQIKVETHILDEKKYLYHEIVEVLLFDFIRPEKTFAGVKELQEQIRRDIEVCRKLTK